MTVDWKRIKALYKLNYKITGVVEHHAPFGIFIDINEEQVRGLIQITDFLDSGIMRTDLYPEVGSKVTAVIIGYTGDERNQIWLSLKPSVLQKAHDEL